MALVTVRHCHQCPGLDRLPARNAGVPCRPVLEALAEDAAEKPQPDFMVEGGHWIPAEARTDPVGCRGERLAIEIARHAKHVRDGREVECRAFRRFHVET